MKSSNDVYIYNNQKINIINFSKFNDYWKKSDISLYLNMLFIYLYNFNINIS